MYNVESRTGGAFLLALMVPNPGLRLLCAPDEGRLMLNAGCRTGFWPGSGSSNRSSKEPSSEPPPSASPFGGTTPEEACGALAASDLVSGPVARCKKFMGRTATEVSSGPYPLNTRARCPVFKSQSYENISTYLKRCRGGTHNGISVPTSTEECLLIMIERKRCDSILTRLHSVA